MDNHMITLFCITWPGFLKLISNNNYGDHHGKYPNKIHPSFDQNLIINDLVSNNEENLMTHEWEFSHVKSTGYFLKVKVGIPRPNDRCPMDKSGPWSALDRFWSIFISDQDFVASCSSFSNERHVIALSTKIFKIFSLLKIREFLFKFWYLLKL